MPAVVVTSGIEPWSALLQDGREDGRLVQEAFERERDGEYSALPDLHADVVAALGRRGIDRLYAHQATAIARAWEGPAIVTTATASGKSLCFNLPVADVLCADRRARALYLYPTKALAQDQARALNELGLTDQVRPAIYDGDTPREARAAIRRSANVVISNPDMLHVGILPNHGAWAGLFANLAFVVIDEAHVYRGVFGSHVANVLRRTLRVAAAYGCRPRVLMASATIGNPVGLAARLTGLDDLGHIDRDASPRARRHIALWNPPVLDEALGTRSSALSEAAEIVERLVRGGARTICFVKSRKAVELLTRMVSERLRVSDPDLAELVSPYRAGYTPQQRRAIEQRLLDGELRGIVTTDALELGIDIGDLDAAVVLTFPGTVASLRQMWGRAGRRAPGLALYVAGDDALDQYFCRNPDALLERPVEEAILDHESPEIYAQHLLCAAHEGPLGERDGEFLGPRWEAAAEALVAAGELVKRRGAYALRHAERYPAAEVSLRSSSPATFAIVDETSGEVLGTTESARAHSTVHDGAIYIHQGRSFEVTDLDLEARHALVRPFSGDWYTQPKRETDTEIVRLLDRRDTLGVTLSFGEVTVSETVLAYQRKRLPGHEPMDVTPLDLPRHLFATQALWYEIPDGLLAQDFPTEILLGTLHAAEHSQIAVLPLLAMCDRWDIGGLSTNLHPQTGGPAVFIYDGHPGGVGLTRQAFRAFETLVSDAHRLLSDCPCASGCPSCVQSPKCGNLNEPLSKAGALELMATMLNR